MATGSPGMDEVDRLPVFCRLLPHFSRLHPVPFLPSLGIVKVIKEVLPVGDGT
ncbi:hypothetical protein KDA_75190 [Dictyobacter alpinus]|uniref:Uncharacterized protein n=1 Tax=Dictyobacter alpinus TaxID=2014873 RepID=A0A402BKZ3_9CHLR|nr:hypothetical protein KDA_75190 [Dictyobacter alpinus]